MNKVYDLKAMLDREKLDGKCSDELYKCLTIKGYDLARTLYNNLDKDDKEFYKEDYDNLKQILINYDTKQKMLEMLYKRIKDASKDSTCVDYSTHKLCELLKIFYSEVKYIFDIKDEAE